MRYQPNYLDPDLSSLLTADVARALTGSGDSDRRRFVQLSYIYDVLRSLAEAGHCGGALPTDLSVLDDLMMRVQQLQTELTTGDRSASR